ncbi:DUF192 domain-containing protein [Candidatus Kaiserbacteria bacterium]|nr:DUF192 domain-containing protein [Candidatus Kaiserbacteria bacterium]
MRKLLTVLVIIAIPLIYFLYMFQDDTPIVPPRIGQEPPLIRIGNVPLRVEVADTPALRERGLGGRDTLAPTEGMLFIFDKSDYHKIWMLDMKLVIDVIWVDEQFTVVDIKKELRPDTYPRIFEPKVPARFVIETNQNYTESFGIKIGDKVTIPDDLIPEDLKNTPEQQ